MTTKNVRADVVCNVCGLVAEACPEGVPPSTWVRTHQWKGWDFDLCQGCFTAIDNRLFDIGQDITFPQGVGLFDLLNTWPHNKERLGDAFNA